MFKYFENRLFRIEYQLIFDHVECLEIFSIPFNDFQKLRPRNVKHDAELFGHCRVLSREIGEKLILSEILAFFFATYTKWFIGFTFIDSW